MQKFDLDVLPNQQFSFVTGNFIYRIRVYTVETDNQAMCVDININGQDVILGARALVGSFLLPWDSLTQGNGNFIFYAPETQNVWWQDFGPKCQLWYLNNNEMHGIF
jgi:hypothetical protein